MKDAICDQFNSESDIRLDDNEAFGNNVDSGKKTENEKSLLAWKRRAENALEIVAELVAMDSVYIPIFERVERDLEDIESKLGTISRARKIVDQKAMRRTASVSSSSLGAP